MSLVDGLSQHTWENQTLYAYKLSENEHLGLVSLPWGEVQNISEFMNVAEDDKGNTIKVNFVLNCHYFDMSGGTNGYLGRCQSFTADDRTLGVDDDGFEGYNGTTDKPYTDLVILNDGTIKYGDFNSWDYPKSEVILGVAPAGVELDNGEDKDWYSPACGYSKITDPNTQSLLVKLDDGSFVLVAVTGSLSPKTCRDWTKSVGGVHQSCYDSGGSTQAIVRYSDDTTETIRNTGRAIPTAFVAYEIVTDSDEGDTGDSGSSGESGDNTGSGDGSGETGDNGESGGTDTGGSDNTDPGDDNGSGDNTNPDSGDDSGDSGGNSGTTPPESETPTLPEDTPTEGGNILSIVNDKINQIKNVKEEIKQALVYKDVDMTDVPFTEYPAKIESINLDNLLEKRRVYLYKNGDDCLSVSGGWTKKYGSDRTVGATSMTIKNATYYGTVNTFDLTLYKQVVLEGTLSAGSFSLGFTSGGASGNGGFSFGKNFTRFIFPLDNLSLVSTTNEGIQINAAASSTIEVTAVYLELKEDPSPVKDWVSKTNYTASAMYGNFAPSTTELGSIGLSKPTSSLPFRLTKATINYAAGEGAYLGNGISKDATLSVEIRMYTSATEYEVLGTYSHTGETSYSNNKTFSFDPYTECYGISVCMGINNINYKGFSYYSTVTFDEYQVYQ